MHVPLAVEKADVTGVAPAAVEQLFGSFRVAIISLDRHRAAQTNLAKLTRGNFPTVVIQDFYQHCPDGLADGVAMGRAIFGFEDRDLAAVRGGIGFVNMGRKLGHDLLCQVGSQMAAGDADVAQ